MNACCFGSDASLFMTMPEMIGVICRVCRLLKVAGGMPSQIPPKILRN